MITDEVLAEIPATYRSRMENGSSPDGDEVVEAFELVIELAEEVIELKRWRNSHPSYLWRNLR